MLKLPIGWLKEHVDVPVEPRKLADDLTAAGLAVDAIEGQGDAAVLELDITTNRVDAMNVRGIAREVAVIYGRPLKPLELGFQESGPAASESLRVVIEAPELCPRFCARVLDVRVGQSPAWLRERLEAVGVRPISNIVDLTNYVMLELGQPSHAFDLARIPDAELRVRWGREGERLTTLDGVERSLTPRVGVVASPGGGLALAGIMAAPPARSPRPRGWSPWRPRIGTRFRSGAGRVGSACTRKPRTASSAGRTRRLHRPPRHGWRT